MGCGCHGMKNLTVRTVTYGTDPIEDTLFILEVRNYEVFINSIRGLVQFGTTESYTKT